MKIDNKRELQNVAINHSADIDYQEFMKAMPYKVEIVERKDPIVQLEASKLSIKNLFNDIFK